MFLNNVDVIQIMHALHRRVQKKTPQNLRKKEKIRNIFYLHHSVIFCDLNLKKNIRDIMSAYSII